MESNLTNVIFKNHNIEIVKENINNYFVIANNDIPAGELLLMECGLLGTLEQLNFIVKYSTHINGVLYPRIKDPLKNEEEFIHEKIMRNIFGDENPDLFYLFRDISSVNHSCDPNSSFYKEIINIDNSKEYNLKFLFGCLFSIKDIKKGEEINFIYNFNMGHNDKSPFKCNCTLTDDEKKIIFKKTEDMIISEEVLVQINKILIDFTLSRDFVKFITLQYLGLNGYIIDGNNAFSNDIFVNILKSKINDDTIQPSEYIYTYLENVYLIISKKIFEWNKKKIINKFCSLENLMRLT